MKVSNRVRAVERLQDIDPAVVYVVERQTVAWSNTTRYDFFVRSKNGLTKINREVASLMKVSMSKIIGKENVLTKKTDTSFLTRVACELSFALGHVVEYQIL